MVNKQDAKLTFVSNIIEEETSTPYELPTIRDINFGYDALSMCADGFTRFFNLPKKGSRIEIVATKKCPQNIGKTGYKARFVRFTSDQKVTVQLFDNNSWVKTNLILFTDSWQYRKVRTGLGLKTQREVPYNESYWDPKNLRYKTKQFREVYSEPFYIRVYELVDTTKEEQHEHKRSSQTKTVRSGQKGLANTTPKC